MVTKRIPTVMPAGWTATNHCVQGDPQKFSKAGTPFIVVKAIGYWALERNGKFVHGPHGGMRKFKSASSAARAADKGDL